MAFTLGAIDKDGLSPLDKARAASRKAKEERDNATLVIDGYELRPAAPPGVGWVITPTGALPGPPWFLYERDEAIGAIPRHKARYGACIENQHDE